MKKEVMMKRPLGDMIVMQSSKNGFLSATDLVAVYKKETGDYKKQLQNYWRTQTTKDFLKKLAQEEGVEESDLVKTARWGKDRGTLVHPYLFVDIALWLSTDFKYVAISWICDRLVEYRNLSGDNFMEMNAMLDKEFGIGAEIWIYKAIASTIAGAIGIPCGQWEDATEKQLRDRHELQSLITMYAYGSIGNNAWQCATQAIKAWKRKRQVA